MTVQIARKLFSVSDYARMRESGILAEDDRVELIGGEVRSMTPIGPQHAAIVKRLNTLLTRQLADIAIVGIQDPIRLSDFTEPQPDIAILQQRADFYAAEHPGAADVLLVIEVADTSAEYDRYEKIPRYAEAGIAEAWLVDVANQVIEQYTLPRSGRYLNLRRLEHGDIITSSVLSAIELRVAQVL
jgi:Uma2 family endonuclease